MGPIIHSKTTILAKHNQIYELHSSDIHQSSVRLIPYPTVATTLTGTPQNQPVTHPKPPATVNPKSTIRSQENHKILAQNNSNNRTPATKFAIPLLQPSTIKPYLHLQTTPIPSKQNTMKSSNFQKSICQKNGKKK
ncbi:hypothetical protein Droror1_Dr00002462 [Drosera rotundifolia]